MPHALTSVQLSFSIWWDGPCLTLQILLEKSAVPSHYLTVTLLLHLWKMVKGQLQWMDFSSVPLFGTTDLMLNCINSPTLKVGHRLVLDFFVNSIGEQF